MRISCFIVALLCWCGVLGGAAGAETFRLNDGRTLTGEAIGGSADDTGLQIRLDEGRYERVPWTAFSQDDLRRLAQDERNPRMAQLAAQYIEVTPEERIRAQAIEITEHPRLKRPEKRSLFGAIFSSGVGISVLLLLYAANLYAAYEVSLFSGKPPGLVCGVSAVLPLIGPILFLVLPSRHGVPEDEIAPAAPAVIQTYGVPNTGAGSAPGAAGREAPPPGAYQLAQPEANPSATSAIPQTQVFQRGAFTFNRRFFETKFPGFFGVVRRDSDKGMVILIKSARGEYVGQRISRISSNELHLQIHQGSASQEVMIPFAEIQEVQLKHETA